MRTHFLFIREFQTDRWKDLHLTQSCATDTCGRFAGGRPLPEWKSYLPARTPDACSAVPSVLSISVPLDVAAAPPLLPASNNAG